MFAPMLTLCLSNGECYDTAPESYSTVAECWTDYHHLIETKQVAEGHLACVYIPEESEK